MDSISINQPGTNSGHGHIWKRPDGVKFRCGGPGLCAQCRADQQTVETIFQGHMSGIAVALDQVQLASLRALRLWHWQGVMYRRKAQQSMEAKGKIENAEWQERQANFHLKAVQTLNDFFPAGDTAERDAAQ